MIESKLKMKSKDNKVKIILFRQLFFSITLHYEDRNLKAYRVWPKTKSWNEN